MLASVTMCNDDIRNYNRKIIEFGDLGYLTLVSYVRYSDLLLENPKIYIPHLYFVPFLSYLTLNNIVT